MGPLRKVQAPLSLTTCSQALVTSSSANSNSAAGSSLPQPPFRLLRIVRGGLTAAAASHGGGPIMLRTLSMPGHEVFRSMQVHTSSKTPYSDATQVRITMTDRVESTQLTFPVTKGSWLAAIQLTKAAAVSFKSNRPRFSDEKAQVEPH